MSRAKRILEAALNNNKNSLFNENNENYNLKFSDASKCLTF